MHLILDYTLLYTLDLCCALTPTFGDSNDVPPEGVFLPDMIFSFVVDESVVFVRLPECDDDDCELVWPDVPGDKITFSLQMLTEFNSFLDSNDKYIQV